MEIKEENLEPLFKEMCRLLGNRIKKIPQHVREDVLQELYLDFWNQVKVFPTKFPNKEEEFFKISNKYMQNRLNLHINVLLEKGETPHSIKRTHPIQFVSTNQHNDNEEEFNIIDLYKSTEDKHEDDDSDLIEYLKTKYNYRFIDLMFRGYTKSEIAVMCNCTRSNISVFFKRLRENKYLMQLLNIKGE